MDWNGAYLLAALTLLVNARPTAAQRSAPMRTPVHILGIVTDLRGEARIVCRQHAAEASELTTASAINRMADRLFEPVPDLSAVSWHDEDVFVEPRTTLRKGGQQSATFQVAYSGFSSEAQAAFQYAVDIWSTRIVSDLTIQIEASWNSLDDNVLGTAGPTYFDDAETEQDWFVPALANAIRGSDALANRVDIVANFNSDFTNWYFGLDGQTPSGRIDFVTVVLHEIGHGLGFLGSMKVDNGADAAECDGVENVGCWGFEEYPGIPVIYDRFAADGGGRQLINESVYPNPSAALGDALQGDRVVFTGEAAVATYAGAPPPLFAPSEWETGSSYSHLDESTFGPGDPSALMTPSVSASEAVHDPGPLGCAIFADMRWMTTADCGTLSKPETPAVPVLSSPPDGAQDLLSPVTFEWRAADRAETYDLQVSLDRSFPSPEVDVVGISDTTYTVEQLQRDTVYYWRVRSSNMETSSEYSITYDFTTAPPPAVPVVPVVIRPEDGAADVEIPTDFLWSEAADSDYYEIQVASDSSFDVVVVDSSRIDTTRLRTDALEHASAYFWRVRAINDVGRSVWTLGAEFMTVSDSTNVASETEEAIPERFGIVATYPNPFRDGVRILIVLPHAMEVRVEIFDVQGRRVRQLVDGTLRAGSHEVRWTASGMPSGAYLCTLEADGRTSSRKILLVR